jgi:hypothetical protein
MAEQGDDELSVLARSFGKLRRVSFPKAKGVQARRFPDG